MDNLFNTAANGYACNEVEAYIETLREQYKKIYDYANNVKANNAKLKEICRSLSEENKALKANTASSPDNSEAKESAAKLSDLIDELSAQKACLMAALA